MLTSCSAPGDGLTGALTSPAPLAWLVTASVGSVWLTVEWGTFHRYWKQAAVPGHNATWLSRWLSWITLHALVSTLATPLARLEFGKWIGSVTFMYVVGNFGAFQPFFNDTLVSPLRGTQPVVDIYPASSRPGMDRYYGCHAFFALLWIVVAYVQMTVTVTSRKRHSAWSRVAMLSFGAHMCASLAILHYDTLKATTFNKIKLLEVTILSPLDFRL